MSPVLANRALFILSLAGIGVSAYLTIAYVKGANLGCVAGSDCDVVRESRYAWGLGIDALRAIPTPAAGMAAYMLLAALSFARVASPDRRVLAKAQFILAVPMLAISAYLTYLEAYVIHAWCQWCVLSAVLSTVIFLVAGAEQISAARPGPGAIREELG